MPTANFYKQPTLPEAPPTGAPSEVPTRIGPYLVDSLLNKGGMSYLFLGTHPETRRPLAIKVLSPAFLDQPDAISRFLKEAQMIVLAEHPNIVKLYGQGEWEQGLYIAMEFIQGISLRHCIVQESLSLRKALEVTLQIAYALLHLHSNGIIHRDLKPENILMTEDGQIKVIDFGIAQLHHESSSPTLMGTPSYMSPELKNHSDHASFSSDLYALGVILYELITQRLSHGVINLNALPKGLKQIIAKTVAVSPSERYQTTTELIHDISFYLSSGEIDREKPDSDRIKELYETLLNTANSFSPSTPPTWQHIDCGLAKVRSIDRLGLYHDFIRLPDPAYLIVMAASPLETVDSIAHISYLRGLLLMALRDLPTVTKWRPSMLNSIIHPLLRRDSQLASFGFSLLLLDPLRDQLTYLSCGLSALIHLPQGSSHARPLAATNPPLGSDAMPPSFVEIQDNWNEGDLLLMHTFEQDPPIDPTSFATLLAEQAFFSPQRQADAFLKASYAMFPDLLFPRLALCMQRIT